ncbi:MAG: NfeD family protein [Acidimicrobiales bacterium]
MGWLPDEPAVVLVALTLSIVLLLVEVALPTLGVAGLSALALGALALSAAGEQGHPWWPLLGVAIAVCLWAGLLVARRRSPPVQAAAAVLFGAGSLGYGFLAADPASVGLAVAGSVLLPASFGPLSRAANRLAELPPQTGMEALVGRSGSVVAWREGAGTVRVDGSLWNARGPVGLAPGSAVVVRDHRGMTVVVAAGAPVP